VFVVFCSVVKLEALFQLASELRDQKKLRLLS